MGRWEFGFKKKGSFPRHEEKGKFLFADRRILEDFFSNYLKTGKPLADKILKILVDNFPSNLYYLEGNLLVLARGEFKQAEGLFEQLSATDKESPWILLQRADLHEGFVGFQKRKVFRRLLKQQTDPSLLE